MLVCLEFAVNVDDLKNDVIPEADDSSLGKPKYQKIHIVRHSGGNAYFQGVSWHWFQTISGAGRDFPFFPSEMAYHFESINKRRQISMFAFDTIQVFE